VDILQETGKGDIPWLTAEIRLEYESEEMAKAIFQSIEVDNYKFVECTLQGNRVVCRARAESPSKLRHTIDDLLACVLVAEEVYRTS